jgi:acetyl esterase/lipase
MPSQEMQDFVAMMRAQRDSGANPALAPAEARIAFAQTLAALPGVPGGQAQPVDAGGVAAEWIETGIEPAGTLLYFHGGGYMEGSPETHRRLVTALALAAGVRALSVDYRLAPENPFPAAVDDALTAYRWLTGPGAEDPSRVIVAGDSAGGGLSVALLVALRDAGDDLPAGAYLISPWTDLTGSGETVKTRADLEPMLDGNALVDTARLYRPEGSLDDPLVSPLFAEMAGLPPLLIDVGDYEILLDDAARLADRAARAGVAVDYEVWPGAFHVFQMLVGLVPEATDAVQRAGAWMSKLLAA